tara:strand:+ start:22 stop:750 length:729 start_codon:yes stop_codon:yes gene_type:complete
MSNQSKLAALASTGVTKAELNNIDGGTARGTTAVADGDGFLTNDGGTMRMTKVDTLATYMGTKITGGSLVYIASSGAISNEATVQFRAQDGHFDATKYDHYEFWFQHVIPVNDNVNFKARTSTNNGGAYASGSGDYHVAGAVDRDGLVVTYSGVGSDTNEFGISGKFYLFSPHTTSAYTYAKTTTVYQSQSTGAINGGQTNSPNNGISARLAAEDVDAIQFLFATGNIESGEIVMYGIANGT